MKTTQGNGPWGNRTWTYDKTGNRLTHAETGDATQTYTYVLNGVSKNTSRAPRPVHGLAGPGTNWQEWTDEAIGSYHLKCWLKRVGR